MKLSEIDKNLAIQTDIPEKTVWQTVPNETFFSLHGVYRDETADGFIRMPTDIAKTVSPGVERLSYHTSGGRVAFVTDSDTISLYASVHTDDKMVIMPWSGQACFDLYIDGAFQGLYRCEPASDSVCVGTLRKSVPTKEHGLQHVVIDFPSYAEVKKLAIGVQSGAVLRAENPYKDAPPILYYGSSITQGASSSRPGLIYQNYLARAFGYDYINLGFAGCCKGEPEIAAYLSGIESSLFVCDFDHNITSPKKLAEVHYPLYRAYRDRHPDTPILFLSRPDFDFCSYGANSRAVIADTVRRAKAEGDRNVYFLDGETIYGEQNRGENTVDACHPNDNGFRLYYQALFPFFERILGEKR